MSKAEYICPACKFTFEANRRKALCPRCQTDCRSFQISAESSGHAVPLKFIIPMAVIAIVVIGSFMILHNEEEIAINDVESFLNIEGDGRYVLETDIDLSGIDWEPRAFSGTLDGNGHTISNLTISDTRSSSYNGLFSKLTGIVKNLNLKEVSIEAQNAGAVTGILERSGSIENVVVTGNIGYVKGAVIGGLAGEVRGEIIGCTNSAKIFGHSNIGGIAGSGNGRIANCTNTGSVASSGEYLGGIIGASDGHITDCENRGLIQGTDYVGGICGIIESSGITDCRTTGDVDGSSCVGGIVGYSEAEVQNCTVDCKVISGLKYVGGVYGCANGHSISNERTSDKTTVVGNYSVGGIVGHLKIGNISDSVNNSTIKSSGDSASYIGGLVGAITNGNISNCENRGNIESIGSSIGGIVGYLNHYGVKSFTISHSSNFGSVSTNGVYIGGIFGGADIEYAPCKCENLTNEGSISGQDYVGGIGGTSKKIGYSSMCFNTGIINCTGLNVDNISP